MPIEKLKLPKGRVVGGHPVKPEDKLDFYTKKPVLDQQGNKIPQWRVEYAIPKQEFLTHVWPHMQAEAMTAFPNWQQIMDAQTGLPLENSDFSWKLVDGDSPKCPKGSQVPYNTRTGYPGHYILHIKTEAFAPDCVVFKNGAYHNVDENQVKVGDYIVANVDIKVHTNNDGGLYINPNIFELVELGEAISTGGGGNPNQLLGDASSRTDAGFQGNLPQAGQVAPTPQAGNVAGPVHQPQAVPASTGMAQAALPAQTSPSNITSQAVPAHDIVQGATAGNVPVPNAGLPAAPVSAQPATTFQSNPTNLPPGLPPQR